MTDWHVFSVEDDEEFRSNMSEFFADYAAPNGDTYRLSTHEDFDQALTSLATVKPHVLVLDVRNYHGTPNLTLDNPGPEEFESSDIPPSAYGDQAGISIYRRIRARRFIPVIFFTAAEHLVSDLHTPPFVYVLAKADGVGRLATVLDEIIESNLPGLLKDLDEHVDEVIRHFIGSYFEASWHDLQSAGVQKADLARQIVQYLARSLRQQSDENFKTALSAPEGEMGRWHPSLFYSHPPIGHRLDTGDVVRLPDGKYGVVVTPTCVLEHAKFDKLTLIRAERPGDSPVTAEWIRTRKERLQSGNSNYKDLRDTKKIKDVLRGQSPRYFHLPAYLNVIPELIVDVENIMSIPKGETSDITRLVSLADNYRSALLATYTRYFHRVGLEDPPSDILIERLGLDP